MSALHLSTSIFIDFENTIADTDTFVCEKLYESFKNEPDVSKNHPIHYLFDIINAIGVDRISDLATDKTTINIFEEIIDTNLCRDDDGKINMNKVKILCEDIYDTVLYYDYKNKYDMRYTTIASAISSLINDTQLEVVYVYMKYVTPFLHESLYYKFKNNDKIKIVSGDKMEFLHNYKCSTYVLNNIMDLNILPDGKSNSNKSDILILKNKPNTDKWNTVLRDKDGTHSSLYSRLHAEISFVNPK